MKALSTPPIVGGDSLDTAERARAYIAAAQRDLNVHLRRLGSPTLLAVDGEWDDHTQLAFEQVCQILGIAADRNVRTFRLIGAAAAERTDAETKRAAKEGAAFERELRARFDGAPPARPRTVVGGSSLPAEARSRAYVAGAQRDLNRHLLELGSPTVLAVDGHWGEETDRAFRRVCKVLGIEAKRNVRSFRVIAGAAAPRSKAELDLAAGSGAAYAAELRAQFARAPEPVPDPPKRKQPEPRADSLEAGLRAAGVRWPDIIARECRRSGLAPSLVCAVIEVETGFRNVFGHDAVRNPVKSPAGALKDVTEAEYKRYLHFRARGLGNQGVGPMQLTSPGLQDRADALGGCWNVGPNIRVGCEFLAGNIARLGLRAGVIAYNGGAAYAGKVFPAQQRWAARLGGVARPDGGGSGPRTLKLRDPRMRGNDVTALQKLVNRRFAELHVGTRITVDGEFGPETRTAARRVAHALGLDGLERGITPAHRSKLRRPTRRTREELARAVARKPWVKKLRAASSSTGNYPLGVRGPIIGRPGQGTHTRGNWQSDNALDIRVPVGTPVFALGDGVITKTFNSPTGVTAGWQVTLEAAANAWFYGHLQTLNVRAGERVRKGQTIGTSGSANGVPHLHLGQKRGRPDFQ